MRPGAPPTRPHHLPSRATAPSAESWRFQRALTQQESVGEVQELVAHVLALFGDEAQFVGDQEALGERRGDIALVPKEVSEEAAHLAGRGAAVVGGARGEAQREQIAAIVDHQMALKPQNQPTDVLPRRASTRKTRWCAIRAGRHTLSEVESRKLISE